MVRSASTFGFRRRCAWCGVILRGWQLNACRTCKVAIVYTSYPPCPSGSRWDADPDDLPIPYPLDQIQYLVERWRS